MERLLDTGHPPLDTQESLCKQTNVFFGVNPIISMMADHSAHPLSGGDSGSGGGGGGGPSLPPSPSPPSPSSSPRCALASCLAELVGRFKRCSRCKLAHYCSGEHQAEDWPAHRDLCNAERARAEAAAQAGGLVVREASAAERERARVAALSVRELKAELERRGVRVQGMNREQLVDALLRTPEPTEVQRAEAAAVSEAAAAARRCRSCGEQPAKIAACSVCFSAGYCGKDCQRADWPRHKSECKSLRVAWDAALAELRTVGIAPARIVALVRARRDYPGRAVFAEAAAMAITICTGEDAGRAECIAGGAAAALVELAGQAAVKCNVEAARFVAGAMANLSVSADGQAKLLASGAAPVLVALAGEGVVKGSAGAAQYVAGAMASLGVSADGQAKLLACGAPPALVALAGEGVVKGSADAAEWVARAMAKLGLSVDGQAKLLACGAAPALVALAGENVVKGRAGAD